MVPGYHRIQFGPRSAFIQAESIGTAVLNSWRIGETGNLNLVSERDSALVFHMFSGFPALLQQLGNEAGPTGLVTRTHAAAAVTVEILMKLDEVTPV